METLQAWLGGLLSGEQLVAFVRAAVTLAVGLVLAAAAARLVRHVATARVGAQHAQTVARLAFYVLAAVVLLTALQRAGLDVSVLLGAAGILTVAIGFASQTSASNIISGIFLLGERPFVAGDIITAGGQTGEIVSVDLLSVTMRTFDNLAVRIPNETLLKSQFTTLTRYPIRRLDVAVGVAYKEDLPRVFGVLKKVADDNPLCLDEPVPLLIFLGFGDSSLNIQFSVWSARERFLELRNSIYPEIKRAFDEVGIEIPFPHRSLYTGAATEPFPVRLVGSASSEDTP